MRVKATREGLIGGKTASGYKVDDVVPFVALPAKRALHKFVKLYNPENGNSCIAIVLDVGPWNTDDESYVFLNARPQSETGVDRTGRPTNKAGIDLSEKVWKLLGMKENTIIEWEFIS